MHNQQCGTCHWHDCHGTENDYQLLDAGHLQLGNGRSVSSHWVQTPPPIQQAYEQMLAVLQPRRHPRLVCRNRSGGGGGRWFAHGVIVLGLDELSELASTIWSNISHDPSWLGPLPDFDDFMYRICLLVLAHELGHELNYQGFTSGHDDHPEAAADSWAGWFTGRLDLANVAIGQHVFFGIGCNRQRCTHPPSVKREQAFLDGYANGERVRQEAAVSYAYAVSQASSDIQLAKVALAIVGALAVGGIIASLASNSQQR